MRAVCLAVLLLPLISTLTAAAQTNTTPPDTNASAEAARSEQIRAACIEGRRYICGKVLQSTSDGMVVDSGYAGLLKPPPLPSNSIAGFKKNPRRMPG